ncbi:Male sterility, NAD-binding protein [Akanthomyces lecanii RCEF 1005]|uniref:Male sterility, NAD-binding protein n=1 Tax=Akanthomyces lecanii RCEF 1005 TaxID=1081108 RepID=A0A162KJQ9_CORDF|nr:Male sterility, NAD-binding protein [Akanthomyces lecanii RCEF 1005]
MDGAEGYTATKWVSEVFLERINSLFGLEVTIHRPSNIICDGGPETNIINNLLEYSRRMRAVPQLESWEGHFDFVQGQIAASNIVESLMTSMAGSAQDGHRNRLSVQHIHESRETVIPINGLSAYLAKDEGAPFQIIALHE